METFLSLCVGIGLAAACGFRVFVPLLAIVLPIVALVVVVLFLLLLSRRMFLRFARSR